ncbi:asparaginase [Bacillus sp. CGMCC 1.16607]|uniref:asparaginase n=1 Tax=Bacillus sp. CGMCC 1.16607 TaxID=3351842 RepID=UPI003643CB10
MKKTILIIHTGGTISMSEDSITGAVKPGEHNPLLDKTNSLTDLANVIVEEPFNLPSPHITSSEMLQLKDLIEKHFQQNQIDGVVITHGTDTLEETAYFLDLTVRLDIPIVVTGAMRSSNEIGSDGLYNLMESIRVASNEEAKGKGVLVVLNDEIHTAKNVTKTHTSNVSTFQSPQYGPIGIITKRGIVFHHAPTNNECYEITSITKKVVLIKAYAGMDSTLLLAISNLQYDGVVIEALGQGNLPPATVEGIKKLIENKISVVLVSRCFNGIVQDIYSYEGGGKQLKDLGVIFSNGLNGQKARLKLLIALSYTSDMKEVETIFQH